MNGVPGCESAARLVNRQLDRLCELTRRCLQAIGSDDLDVLPLLLDQRQATMLEIDRLQNAMASPMAGQADVSALRPSPALDAERRDLIHLLGSLDSELIRLATLKRDLFRADFQKALSLHAGSAGSPGTAGRLFNRIG